MTYNIVFILLIVLFAGGLVWAWKQDMKDLKSMEAQELKDNEM